MNSTIVSYSMLVPPDSKLKSPDGEVVFETPLLFARSSTMRKVRLLKATISSLIPNIFSNSETNNGLMRISRSGGSEGSWVPVQLPNGVYSVSMIEQGINSVANGAAWYSDPTDPALKLQFNLATQLVYVKIDSSKLTAGGTQFAIDFGSSEIWKVLGFSTVNKFDADGIYGASQNAQLDWFGNNISVLIEGMGMLSWRNGASSYEICTIPIGSSGTGGSVGNEYIYPVEGIVSPAININLNDDRLTSLKLSFVGSRYDKDAHGNKTYRPIYLIDGEATVALELIW